MKPILFNTEMVKAILDGRKTVTRRSPFKFEMKEGYNPDWSGYSLGEYYTGHIETGVCLYSRGAHDVWGIRSNVVKPKYKVGDILYVRETWGNWSYDKPESNAVYYQYRADYPDGAKTYMFDKTNECDLPKWHPSLHMPKEAARIFLRVTGVRAERLQDIDKNWDNYDKEGMRKPEIENISIAMQERFISIWNSTIPKKDPAAMYRYGWKANPWVWVIEFERIDNPELLQEVER